MEITGKIIAALPERSGVSASTGNQWKTGAYVLETMEQYPKRICFEVFGTDKLQQFAIQIGEIVTISFDVDAHEYQGRWFNSIRAWKVIRPGYQANAQAPAQATTPPPYQQGASNPQQPIGQAAYQPSPFGSGGVADSSLPFPPPNN